MNQRQPSLHHDDRGAIVVAGLFMTTFVVGAAYYVAGLGDAMVTREVVQDAADSGAMTASVFQARGMNVLALVNLGMSALLTITVAMKMVRTLLRAATVIACMFPSNPTCALLKSWEPPVASFTVTTSQSVQRVNTALHQAQTALAQAMPLLAAAQARVQAQGPEGFVDESAVLMLSAVPGAGSAGAPGRMGMPVQGERFDNFCVHSATEIKEVMFKPFKFLPGSSAIVAPIQRLVAPLLEALVRAAPSYFCDGGSDRETPAAPFAEANLGDDHYATWIVSLSRRLGRTDTREGVRIASAGGTSAGDAPMPSFQSALSEFYYDTRDDGPARWSESKSESMYNMRWRARLRRVRAPSGPGAVLLTLLSLASPGGSEVARNAIGSFLGPMSAATQELGQRLDQANFTIPGGGALH
jgi:hypothetical protein